MSSHQKHLHQLGTVHSEKHDRNTCADFPRYSICGASSLSGGQSIYCGPRWFAKRQMLADHGTISKLVCTGGRQLPSTSECRRLIHRFSGTLCGIFLLKFCSSIQLKNSQDILWLLDTGIVNNLAQPIKRCDAKVIGIDVKTGKTIKTIDLSNLVVAASRLQYLVADYDGNGNAFM